MAFWLRSAEQTALVAGFARWLNSLDARPDRGPRTRVDLTVLADAVIDRAAGLPHPALEQAARSHAQFLADLAGNRELLHRRVTVAVRAGGAPATPATWR